MTRYILFVGFATILLAVSLAIFVIGGGSSIQAAPQIPHAFFGNVSVGAVPAAPGLRIEARINDVSYAESVQGGVSTTDTTTGSDGTYGSEQNFQVCADDPGTSKAEGGAGGDVITFFVEGIQAQTLSPDDGTAVGPVLFQIGDTTKLDLSIPSLNEATLSATPSEFACTTFGSEPTPTVVVGVCGDGNDDAEVNVFDAIIILQIIVGLIDPTVTQLKLGDVVRDGTINVFDAILLLQHIVGLTEITECGPIASGS